MGGTLTWCPARSCVGEYDRVSLCEGCIRKAGVGVWGACGTLLGPEGSGACLVSFRVCGAACVRAVESVRVLRTA